MTAVWGLVGVVILAAGGFELWLATLPSDVTPSAPPVSASENAAMLEALQPPRRQRPVVAVIGLNDATETTDYIVPTGILRRADIAEVLMLAAEPGPVNLYPALNAVEPDGTIAAFDAEHPDSADYVIVPGIALTPGIDEVALAHVADAWSRTYRSKAVTFAQSPSAVVTANGIRILPDQIAEAWPEERVLSILPDQQAEGALDVNLQAIAERYGPRTATVVAMQLEYPWTPGSARQRP
jgi:putative intracellular protease/amidase